MKFQILVKAANQMWKEHSVLEGNLTIKLPQASNVISIFDFDKEKVVFATSAENCIISDVKD